MISVIIPTYNNLSLLENALCHIKKQSYKDYEIIVVDDSTNEDIQKFMANQPNIRYYHNDPALGPVPNWNYGLSLAKGECVILHHHDEYFDNENHLAKIVQQLKNHDVVVSNIKVFVGKTEHKIIVPRFVKRLFIMVPSLFLFSNVIGPCACFAIKKAFYEPLDENLVWKVDSEWYYRILKNKHAAYINNYCIYSKHGHREQITSSINISEKAQLDIEYLKQKYSDNKWALFILKLSQLCENLKKHLTLKNENS